MDIQQSFLANEKGNELCRQGKFNEALSILKEAVEMNPSNTDAWYSLGGCLASLERYEEAIESYIQVLKINPYDNMAKVTAILAESLYDCWDTNLNFYLTAYECNEFGFNIQAECEDGEVEELRKAIVLFDKSIELRRKFPEPYNNRASVYMRLFEYKKAYKDLESAVQLDPTYAIAWYNKGKCHFNEMFLYLNTGRPFEILNPIAMLNIFEKVLQLTPDDEDAQEMIEKLHYEYGVYREGKEVILPDILKQIS